VGVGKFVTSPVAGSTDVNVCHVELPCAVHSLLPPPDASAVIASVRGCTMPDATVTGRAERSSRFSLTIAPPVDSATYRALPSITMPAAP
jgi:hypothetical protein